jgi:hypothetical protein
MTRTRTAALALLAAVWAAGCGIPADDTPRAISDEQVPADAAGSAAEGDDGQTALADLYFARFAGERGDVLVSIGREVPTGGAPTPATVMEALLDGVHEGEGPDGLVTKIPADTALGDRPELVGGTLVVDLNRAISGVQADGARFAYGQMTCTADALADVDGVIFTVEGQPVRPPAGDGESSTGALTCASYADLLDEPAD